MGSTQRVRYFKRISGGIIPHRDGGMRWHSWFEMLDWATQRKKPVIVRLISDEEALSKDRLSVDDWKILL